MIADKFKCNKPQYALIKQRSNQPKSEQTVFSYQSGIMLAHIAHASLRHASRIAPSVAPVAAKAVSARFATRFMSSTHYAVDAPDGDHDLQDIVSFVIAFQCLLEIVPLLAHC